MWYIEHSAKGSVWKNHKYISVSNGKYKYSDEYRDEIRSNSKKNQYVGSKKKEDEDVYEIDVSDLEKLREEQQKLKVYSKDLMKGFKTKEDLNKAEKRLSSILMKTASSDISRSTARGVKKTEDLVKAIKDVSVGIRDKVTDKLDDISDSAKRRKWKR